MQDHGMRERALMESKAELQKRLFESMIKPQARLSACPPGGDLM